MSFCINPHCPNPQNHNSTLFCQSCGSELLLEGRYRVIGVLGGGGFGKTYEVIERTNTTKVLKVLLHSNSKAVSLFQQEAQVLTQLDNPGIPKGTGYFTFFPKNSQEPLHCLVMEKIEGLNLEQYLQQRSNRPINQELALEWLIELFTILHQVHQQNFFHRDIKPSNIMLKADGQLVLIDFGAAREVTQTYMLKQAAGQVTGINSPGFTPPEQLNGQAVLTSDFFAIGRTFVYLLTGKNPNDPDIYDINNDEVRWRNYAPEISPLLADLIDDLIKRSPSQRPQSTNVILQRLAEIERALKAQGKSKPPKNSSPYRPRSFTRNSIGWNFGTRSTLMVGVASAIAAGAVLLLLIPNLSNFSWISLVKPDPAEKWAKNLTLVNTLTGHSEAVSSVAIAPDGQTIASASHDRTIKLWNPQTGKLIRTIYGHSLPVLSVAISPDSQSLTSGSLDETIKQWNLSNGQQIRSIKADGYVAWNNAIAITSDNQIIATGSADKTVRLWNYTTGQRLRTLYGHSLPVLSVAISPNGQTLASGSTDKTIRVWDIRTGQQLYTLPQHTSWVTCLAISPDNRILASGSLDKTIKLWDLNTGKLLRTLEGHSYSVLAIAISPDAKILASGGLDGEIRLWNLETGKLIHKISAHTKQVVSLAISQDRQTLVSGSADDTIKVWRSP
ncbi:serine/threonine protein kinase [Nostoc sp. CENA67]|uniref:Serine/threonine protein kinase n=1 Tax=Amazonocrinis nigriterrae CENA67 TaxID=2794033 RepID=A0A8J7HSL4_9NOST|nr:serine/threonine-protein kinase [Amazonocrinis nigriterrae]MBH8562983.1 serine/threonine protein kinase [Amazonocrinis nigriterrae CENA67]